MLTGGIDIAKYNDEPGDGERYDIRVKAKDGEFLQQADLTKIYLRNRQGQLMRLDSVASSRRSSGRPSSGGSTSNTPRPSTPSRACPWATPWTWSAAAGEKLPLGYRVQFIGEAEELGKTTRYVMLPFTR